MATRPSIDVSGWLEEQLAQASPDLLRSMVQTFAEALMGAEADAVCGAGYGERSEERTRSCNGCRRGDWDRSTLPRGQATPGGDGVRRAHRADRADRWPVENYQFSFVADERRAGADFLQRLAGLVDASTDREVWMLYSSFMRSLGAGHDLVLRPASASHRGRQHRRRPRHSRAAPSPLAQRDELHADLRLAHRFCEDLYIHSLEGCVEHGFLDRLSSIDWDAAVEPPAAAWVARPLRGLLTAALWGTAHPGLAHGGWLLMTRLLSRAHRR